MTDTWLTPLNIVEACGTFDLDPCAYPGHPTAKRLICLPEDGLAAAWEGRVWLNPPYSKPGPWLEKLARHGNGVALVHARTDTRWFQQAVHRASSVQFLAGRIRFLRPDGTPGTAPPCGSVLLNYGVSFHVKTAGLPGWCVG